ncbi:MAG: endonuclease/exonuclease/phosphatase family protein, partial [Myxococcota bacterium]
MSWNVLADAYAFGQRHHCPSRDLRFEFRLKQAIDILKRAAADLVFLQEVDRVEEWTTALRERLGYETAVARRDRGGQEQEDETPPPDSCVTAWRNMSLVSEERVDYDDDVRDTDRLSKRFRRHNVALVCVLSREGRRFVASNTHVHWDPRRADVKL